MTPPTKKKNQDFENDPPAKFPPFPHPPPHSPHIKDQPPTVLRLGIQEFTDLGLHWQDPTVLTSL